MDDRKKIINLVKKFKNNIHIKEVEESYTMLGTLCEPQKLGAAADN